MLLTTLPFALAAASTIVNAWHSKKTGLYIYGIFVSCAFWPLTVLKLCHNACMRNMAHQSACA